MHLRQERQEVHGCLRLCVGGAQNANHPAWAVELFANGDAPHGVDGFTERAAGGHASVLPIAAEMSFKERPATQLIRG